MLGETIRRHRAGASEADDDAKRGVYATAQRVQEGICGNMRWKVKFLSD